MDLLPASWTKQFVAMMWGANTCFVPSADVARVSIVSAIFMKAGELRELIGSKTAL